LIASLSMGGGLFLSGFWSKDAILLAAAHTQPWLVWVLLLGATMTAGYIFRLYLRCFHGAAPHDATHHPPHESPPIMVAPMAVLAIGAAFVGFVGSPLVGQPLWRLLGDHEVHQGLDLGIAFWSTVALIVGAGLAWLIGFQRRQLMPSSLRPLGQHLYALAANKFYVDELYQRVIIRPFLTATAALSQYDQRVIDGAVNAAGQFGWMLSQGKAWFDRAVVDRIVNGVASVVRGLGGSLRWIQTGVIHQYLITVVVAVAILAVVLRR
jgi:NADH-quinone oxidoreductase subunit L